MPRDGAIAYEISKRAATPEGIVTQDGQMRVLGVLHLPRPRDEVRQA